MKTFALLLSVVGLATSLVLAEPPASEAMTVAAPHSLKVSAGRGPARCGCQLPAGVTLESINRDIADVFAF
jgi:hypothetical protein